MAGVNHGQIQQRQRIMATDALPDPYTQDLNLKTSGHIILCSKLINGLEETHRYNLSRTVWNNFFLLLHGACTYFGI